MPVRLKVALLAIVINNDGIEHHIRERQVFGRLHPIAYCLFFWGLTDDDICILGYR